ncbi:MAG TPA: ComEC/Rec2 family competence protein, partial [Pyrinomonadaceae bacterium]|nr:ComEC/Rec2 family competence protein [Pyrinomonadaceae bacterium]
FRKNKPAAAPLLLVVGFVFTGLALSLIESRDVSPDRISHMYEQGIVSASDSVELTGTIDGQPEPAPQSFYLTLKAERIRLRGGEERDAAGTILLLTHVRDQQLAHEYEALELRHGARLRLLLTLDREDNFRNPGVLPFTEYLEREGYDATGVIKSPLLIERLDDERVFLPLALLYEWREHLQRRIHYLFSPETAGVLDAALLGNHYNISLGAAERFRAGGTFHVLVISGFQIAFIGGLLLLVVRWFTKRRILQVTFAATLLWTYTIAVGADASVARSAFMFTVVLLGPLVSRRAHTLNSLGGAATALLVWHPNDLFDPSFQLTFISVLSIVTIALPLISRMQQVGSWRPAHETPYPPAVPGWFRGLSETLFWSEREWKTEMARSNIRYRLFKTTWAISLERWRLQKLLRFATNAIVISASVQIGMLPMMIIYFHRVSFAALLLNIFVGGLMALLLLMAVAATLISMLSGGLAAPLKMITEKIDWLMIHAVDPFKWLGIDSIRMPHYRGWMVGIYVLYFLVLGLLVIGLARWKPLRLNEPAKRTLAQRSLVIATATFLLLAITIVGHPFSGDRPDGNLHVDFLDVGQGDSALLTMPDGTTLLIDGGGRPNIDWQKTDEIDDSESFERDARSVGERVVSEYLWGRGLDRIDYVLATHADADHIDGLNDVVRNFKVRGAIVARTPVDDPGYRRFAEAMKEMRVAVERIGAGDLMRFGSVSAQVLWPTASGDDNAPSRNNDSVVLRFNYGESFILFTGDVEREAELAMLAAGLDLRSDIVKVAHHGSKTSSVEPFIDASEPSKAIISVGRSSIFGHPNKDVVERWRASGAQVMTTGQSGTISVVTDGHKLQLNTYVR